MTTPTFAPDPPEPFDESTLVDFELEIFASGPDAERYVSELVTAVTPVFDGRGRYQFLPPVRVLDESGENDPVHRNSRRRREPGQQLFSVSFGFRGVGDRSVFGDDVLAAITNARLGFERMTETPLSGGYLAAALSKYPRLR